TYKRKCHCAALRFTVILSPPLQGILSPPLQGGYSIGHCNCSICTKNRNPLAYPRREDVVFQSGEDNMNDYLFDDMRKPLRFCKTCGTSVLIDFSNSNFEKKEEFTAINVSRVSCT
ncbi:hypothetical protein NA57DRAFT_45512, partial [Rhizodiscina lignyota]